MHPVSDPTQGYEVEVHTRNLLVQIQIKSKVPLT
jgi:hypothetical protein